MLYMDNIFLIAIFIIIYIIITGILTFFDYNIGSIGIYIAYLGFIIISLMILPETPVIGGTVANTIDNSSKTISSVTSA